MYLIKVCLLAAFLLLFETKASEFPQELVIGDVITNSNKHFIAVKQVLDEAYDDLGITIDWVPIPGERSLRYSNAGRFDGEMIRAEDVANEFENLVKVPVIIGRGHFHLYCLNAKFCRQKNFDKNTVGYNVQVKLNEQICQQYQFKCATFYNYKSLLNPLYQGKIDAFLAHDLEIDHALDDKSPLLFQSIPLNTVDAYHYLHKKHAQLVPLLAQAIKQRQQKNTAIVKLPIYQSEGFKDKIKPVK